MTEASSATGVLAGIRVIDFFRIFGGPYCRQNLGDHGADVLKIEPPQSRRHPDLRALRGRRRLVLHGPGP